MLEGLHSSLWPYMYAIHFRTPSTSWSLVSGKEHQSAIAERSLPELTVVHHEILMSVLLG